MKAAGQTCTLRDLLCESVIGDTSLVVETADGNQFSVVRVDASQGVIVLTTDTESAQVHLNSIVGKIEELIDTKMTKAVLLKQLQTLFETYEPETT